MLRIEDDYDGGKGEGGRREEKDDIMGSKEELCSACCSVRLARRENTLGTGKGKTTRAAGKDGFLPSGPHKG